MDKVKIILNRSSGPLEEEAKVSRIRQALDVTGIAYEIEASSSAQQGIELARQAVEQGWPVVAAAGGDGTINSVVNGLVQAAGDGQAGTLGIIPLGTANDLADMLDLPNDLESACQRLAARQTRLIDVGEANGHYFANNSAIGLEPMVTLSQDQMRWVKGEIRYVLAALKVIFTAQAWSAKLTWDNGQYEGPVILVSVGNSARTGGVFYMTPDAVLDDGLLDFVYAEGLSRWQMLTLLPKTFKGTHIHHPQVANLKTTTLSIAISPGTPIQADGEVFEQNTTQINYRLIPQKLRVIV